MLHMEAIAMGMMEVQDNMAHMADTAYHTPDIYHNEGSPLTGVP